MRCRLDADILRYEVGSCGQYLDEESGERVVRDFASVEEMLVQRIKEIEEECWSDQPTIFYFTGDERMVAMHNKNLKREGKEPLGFKPNFRYAIAKVKPYKSNRKHEKPFHADNILAYIMFNYPYKIAIGMEADDLIIIDAMKDLDNTIVCTRDKDLRQAGKHHYGWPCGKQPQFGPKEIDTFGEMTLNENKKGVKGEGVKFFYSQLLTGDQVDTIPGLPKCGPVKAFKLLDECTTELELYQVTKAAYEGIYEERWEEQLLEQAYLLYMIQELDDEGKPIMWTPPTELRT